MKFLEPMIVAFSMYSKIPMPRIEWNKENMKYTMCFFPLIGVVTGVLIYLAGMFLDGNIFPKVNSGRLMFAAVMTLIPVFVSGGIHLDGFMDTTDARSSYGDREKKLAILKDSHVGAFAVIGCSFYLILSAGAWSEIDAKGIVVMAMAFVLERAFSGLAAVNFKGARKDGMLTAFREPARKRTVTVVLAAEAVISAIVMCYLWLPVGLLCSLGAVLTFVYYYKMAMKEFGGTTGDLAGWFLQTCELVMLMLTVVGKMILA